MLEILEVSSLYVTCYMTYCYHEALLGYYPGMLYKLTILKFDLNRIRQKTHLNADVFGKLCYIIVGWYVLRM